MIQIIPSILSADFACLGDAVKSAETAGAKAIQIDVMDGRFVPEITFGSGVVAALRRTVNLFLDVHLMIIEPERHLDSFADAGAGRIIVHQEACMHLHRVLHTIKERGLEAGVAINPGTPLESIREIIDCADVVQIMTVDPGFASQMFIHSQRQKIRDLKQMIRQRDSKTAIAVDGGINNETAPLVVRDGATILIAGSSIFNAKGTVRENLLLLGKSVEGLDGVDRS